MDRALEHGINFWDTANVYGRARGEGVTEQIIGRYFAQVGGRREKVVLATKVYGDMGKGDMAHWPNTPRLSALHTRRACQGPLRCLQTDYLDLYQMHHLWREAPCRNSSWPARGTSYDWSLKHTTSEQSYGMIRETGRTGVPTTIKVAPRSPAER